ncbi:protease [Mycolicibacillus koreensis]|nr:alpha/beta hydrolase [Mycolicibacillus koreensis]BBY54240.1 protease [Mycolicibacillus koreensis]
MSLLIAATVVAGCAPVTPGADPRFADSDVHPQGEVTTSETPPPPPELAAPSQDLMWRDCTTRVFDDAAIPPAAGITLECATFDADLDPLNGSSAKITVGAVRARSDKTPEDAAPLVLTTGTDIPSSHQLAVWTARTGADLVDNRPVVAVDRRGIGLSSAAVCRDSFDRRAMADQAQFEPGDDQVANLNKIAITAANNCTDAVPQGGIAYDNAHAAEDLEVLRSRWDVPGLALLGIGNGAQVALAYAASHPNKVARLVLDSPITLGVNAEAAAEQRVVGAQAALDAFAAQCVAMNCALGPNPKGAVDALLADARAGRGPGGAAVSAVAHAIITALGYPSADPAASTLALADILAAARDGDAGGLKALIERSESLRGTDGQYISVCSDSLNRPTPNRVRELVVAWGKQYPQFGAVAALDMVPCLAWPSSSPVEPPADLDPDVLLLGVQKSDPIVGAGMAATAATVLNGGAASKRVMWQGVGHGASVYSPCAVPPVIAYLTDGTLPDSDTFCPA